MTKVLGGHHARETTVNLGLISRELMRAVSITMVEFIYVPWRLQLLYERFGTISLSAIMQILCPDIMNHLLCGDVIWGSLSDTKLDFLQALSHSAMKISRIRDRWSCSRLDVEG